MNRAAELEALRAEMRSLSGAESQIGESLSRRTLAWLTLTPVWPLSIAERGFAVAGQGLATQTTVTSVFHQAEEEGIVRAAAGELPWHGPWYWMNEQVRSRCLERLLRDRESGGVSYLAEELGRIGKQLASIEPGDIPPILERFVRLAEAPGVAGSAAIVDEAVMSALTAARDGTGCPEAYRWIEVAEPLGRIFGGALHLAVERSRRRLEQYERRKRDEAALENYAERADLEEQFEQLILPSSTNWGLHYIGDGGMGKTMLIRRITSHFAEKHGLVTTRVDFDHINPDYPSRAPGLLLIALAEDLRLNEDNIVADLLRKFDEVINSVHRQLESSQRTSAAIGDEVDEGLKEAEQRFIEVLRTISRRSTVVIVLDTCEELARIRPSGKLPNAVLKTFEILNRLHDAVPRLRVVFSGRRPLVPTQEEIVDVEPHAGSHESQSIDPDPNHLPNCLQVVPVDGFDEHEVESFLKGYEPPVEPRFWDTIKRLSKISAGATSNAGRDLRYNPYDLNLYAALVTGEAAALDEKLLSGSAHYYVRERIVRRVDQERIRPWLAHLTRLGVFDLELLERITGYKEDLLARVATEIVRNEWVDVTRGARWRKQADAAKQPSREQEERERTWQVNPNLRRRLVLYFTDVEPDAWNRAQQRLRDILPGIVLQRPWNQLTPEYVIVALELLAATPERALAWWADFEDKIVADLAWEWGKQVVDRLREHEWPPVTRGGKELASPVRGTLLATDAALLTRSRAEGSLLQSRWSDAEQALQNVPDSAEVARLRHRALAGIVSSRRWFDHPMSEYYLQELAAMIERVPPLVAELIAPHGLVDVRVALTELGLIDNVIEILDAIEWHALAPQAIVQLVNGRAAMLRPHLAESRAQEVAAGDESSQNSGSKLTELQRFLDCRIGRLEFLGGRTLFGGLVFLDLPSGVPAALSQSESLHWSAPKNMRMRIALEKLRLLRFAAMPNVVKNWMDLLDGLRDTDSPMPATLDSERFRSALLLCASDWQLVDELPDRLIDASLGINRAAPECAAHREIPPYFEVALRLKADRGEGAAALARADLIAQDSSHTLDIRQAAERVKLYLAMRWRLRELGVGVQTSLERSTRGRDLILAAGAAAFDPKSPAYTGRWRRVLADLAARGILSAELRTEVERWHSELDEFEDGDEPSRDGARFDLDAAPPSTRESASGAATIAVRDDVNTLVSPIAIAAELRSGALGFRSVVNLRCGSRLAASLALEEGALLAMHRPTEALRLFAWARLLYGNDPIGLLLTSGEAALCQVRAGLEQLDSSLNAWDEAEAECRRRGLALWKPGAADEIAEAPTGSISSADDFWWPWLRRHAFSRSILRMRAEKGYVPRDVPAGPSTPDLRIVGAPQPEAPVASAPKGGQPPPTAGLALFGAMAVVFGVLALSNSALVRWVPDFARFGRFADTTVGGTLGIALGVMLLVGALAGVLPKLRAPDWLTKLTAVVRTTATMALGLAFFAAILVSMYRGFEWVVVRTFGELPTWIKLIGFFLALAAIGAIPVGLRGLRGVFERAWRETVQFGLAEQQQGVSDTQRFFLREAWRNALTDLSPRWQPSGTAFDQGSVQSRQSYAQRAALMTSARAGKGPMFLQRFMQWMGMVSNTELIVPTEHAGLPWEATIGLRWTPAKYRAATAFRMRRTSEDDLRSIWAEWFGPPGQPFEVEPMVVALAPYALDPTQWFDRWMRNASAEQFEIGVIPRDTLEPERIGVLHIVDEVLGTERGLALRVGRDQLFPSELVRRFPSLRLLVLQARPRSDTRRFEYDRDEASRAREIAAQVFELGVPAVLVLPSLPEQLALDALEKVMKVIALRPQRAMMPMTYAVHEGQMLLVEKAAEAYSKQPSDEALALAFEETAYDVCWYCKSNLNLRVNETRSVTADKARENVA